MTEDQTKIASNADEHFVALHSGFKLGKYELQAVLGQGGFGITYKAWDGALNRAVAIKEYLPSDVAVRVDGSTVRARSRNDQESFQWGLERFLEEARALARFEATQSIVRVYDYMQDNGTAYMVMALIEGTPLSSVYRREAPLSEERLKAIVLPILDGLDDVHAAGFLHRDIKPANILIRPNGSPVLIDFGAARNALGEKSRSITSVFTPGYAPFEQYTSSGKQGPWTDIYALAATLYHGIAGKAPPQATDRIREDPMEPAVRLGAGRYSPQFLASIDRGLEVFENRRPQSIGQWRDMLTGATTLAVPQTNYAAAPPVQAYGSAPNSQPGHTAVPTLGERGVPSQAPNSQGPISQSPISQGPASQGPASQAPYSQTPPRKSRLPLIAAAIALVLVGGGAAAFFALSPSSERVEETVQQRAQRLADEAKRAADQARVAQDAAEAEMKKRAEQEAAQKAAEQARREQDAELARQAEQAKREAERAQRESDGEAKRKADEEVRKIAEAEAARRLESEKLDQERRALETARAKAEAELAEARRQAEEARSQAEALRLEAEKSRAAAAEADARRKAEDEARKKAEAEAKAKAEAEAKAKAEAAKKKAEDEAKAKAEAAAKTKAEEEARRAQAARAPAPAPAPATASAPAPAPAPAPAAVAAPPAPAANQQAANAPTNSGFVYAGRYGVTIDCPQVDQPPFAQYGTSISGPQFAWDFYRDGKGTGTITGDSMSYRISFTGRSGNTFTGSFSLRATETGFRGSGIVSGFGPSRNGEKACPITFTKR
jgi:serine/threonine protein kinase